ncbi:hypothetical protein HJP15_14945 [Pseudoalteromonas sp. NEC-BIFX-2020_002]|uniref:Lipoprotein n=1 Tax=Pseudoalteromonas neustonica TaxID=1840331 RepID=A0ABU9U312_9GAMM|nr:MULTISPECIES: hypothetical protein [Pseudoalteromonas]NMR27883.1 hypothetical protein [Pseudoalteromonas sp. NEC-BIFX-2020_015]NNG44199.1 hypothetical protein [Pseudoalteromonas sp. NEC-BIFX-2020_002]
MQKLIFTLITTFSLVGCGLQVKSDIPEPDYAIKHNQFVSNNEPIPAGCFAQLMTNLNGDNTTAAVFIESANLRGCNAANYPYPGGDETLITYSIEKILPAHSYQLKVCERSTEGSMSGSCDNVLVKFTHLDYQLPNSTKQVLSVIKLGEW